VLDEARWTGRRPERSYLVAVSTAFCVSFVAHAMNRDSKVGEPFPALVPVFCLTKKPAKKVKAGETFA